ncbi:MAG: cell envelope integrity protein TolA [Deltaproteobacteria bacterium]|nr:cell envelope integrity protein TolA [Deltaproteobacteria bacterium]
MSSSNFEPSGKSSLFWGIVLSLSLHLIVLIIALFWGFGTPKQLGEPQSIEGRLVSLSELETKGGGKLEPSQPEKKELTRESKMEEPEQTKKKKEDLPKVEEKPKEKKVEVPQGEKKEPPKEVKKEEPKKVEVKKEEPPKEEPKKKDVVVLDSKEKKKQEPKEKEKKEDKKQIAKKPEPTEPRKSTQKKETEKKKESSFEDIRRGVLEDMQKTVTDKQRRNVIEDIQKNVGKEEQVAEANSPGSEEAESNYRAGGPRGGAVSGAAIGLFVQRIREEIKDKWKIPQTFSIDENLRTEVVFRMDETGGVYDVRVENTSGNPAFDDFCVKAIYKAVPLTPPPPELLEVAKTEGVKVSFEP